MLFQFEPAVTRAHLGGSRRLYFAWSPSPPLYPVALRNADLIEEGLRGYGWRGW